MIARALFNGAATVTRTVAEIIGTSYDAHHAYHSNGAALLSGGEGSRITRSDGRHEQVARRNPRATFPRPQRHHATRQRPLVACAIGSAPSCAASFGCSRPTLSRALSLVLCEPSAHPLISQRDLAHVLGYGPHADQLIELALKSKNGDADTSLVGLVTPHPSQPDSESLITTREPSC